MTPSASTFDYFTCIAKALATDGGHLAIGHGGYSLHFGNGATLSGHDPDRVRADCIAASLPVIDSLAVDFGTLVDLVPRGPIVAVGQPSAAPPWYGLSCAPLVAVAARYTTAGAQVWNIPAVDHTDTSMERDHG